MKKVILVAAMALVSTSVFADNNVGSTSASSVAGTLSGSAVVVTRGTGSASSAGTATNRSTASARTTENGVRTNATSTGSSNVTGTVTKSRRSNVGGIAGGIAGQGGIATSTIVGGQSNDEYSN